MKKYQSENFRSHKALVDFLNDHKIGKEDIVFITATEFWWTLFYYSE